MTRDRILIVEDEKELCSSIRLSLELNKFEVISAENGKEALSLIWNEPVDLILCDINLPDINGLEILEKVRNDKKLYQTPFVFLSAYSEEADIRHGMNKGADDYLTKPFSIKDLVKTINSRIMIHRKKSEFHNAEINDKWFKLLGDNFKKEFLNPLNGIVNATYLIESTGINFEPKDFTDTITAIYHSSFRMFRNTRNLMMYSTLSNQKFIAKDTCTESIFISDILNQILDYYNNGITNNFNPIQVKADLTDKWRGHSEYINIIFTELIDNAVVYDAQGKSPEVTLKARGKGFEFSVTNNIDVDTYFELKDIGQFRKFHKDDKINGMGIGLYICKELCAQLGYRLTMTIDNNKITFTVICH